MSRLLYFLTCIILLGCEPRQGKTVTDVPDNPSSGIHKITVQEALHTKNYTYIRANEDGNEMWMAIPLSDVQAGKDYYYLESFEMKNFKSKDLDRFFESLYFLDGVYSDPEQIIAEQHSMSGDNFHSKKNPLQKQNINLEPENGITSIKDLYASKASLENQKVIVKGLVTKYNPGIMGKNWVHIQDGTGDEKGFDLTITTQDQVAIGEMVYFEGLVIIDRDFGHGYKYALLLEEGKKMAKTSGMTIN